MPHAYGVTFKYKLLYMVFGWTKKGYKYKVMSKNQPDLCIPDQINSKIENTIFIFLYTHTHTHEKKLV